MFAPASFLNFMSIALDGRFAGQLNILNAQGYILLHP